MGAQNDKGSDKQGKNGKPGKVGKRSGNKKTSSKTVSDLCLIMVTTSILVVGLNYFGVM